MKHYHPNKLRPLAKIIGRIVADNPKIIDEPEYFMAMISKSIPGFTDPKKCLNCGSSMAEYDYQVNLFDALLLYGMAKAVRANLNKGLPFTEANKIHVPTAAEIAYNVKNRTGYASKLGLIAKATWPNKTHLPGAWTITRRGWEALRGEAIPDSITVFRKQILERSEKKITLTTIFENHKKKAQGLFSKGKKMKMDYREQFEDWNPKDWADMEKHGSNSLL